MSLVARYVLPPDEIERTSLGIVEQELAGAWQGDQREVVRRMALSLIHI